MKTAIPQFLVVVLIVCLASLQNSQAVSPPPDGGYSNQNTAEGNNALFHLSSGARNTAVGFRALYTITASSDNTAVGWQALLHNTSGTDNTSTGAKALLSNTTGDGNTATGYQALSNNTIGFSNTANGAAALSRNTTGSNNTAVGDSALLSNIDSFRNNAVGVAALSSHITGNFNNAVGTSALFSDRQGQANNAFGDEALYHNTAGSGNTAIGDRALSENTTGVDNTAIGASALPNSTGTGNIALGVDAGDNVTTANNVICIGTTGRNVSNSCYIGNIFATTVGEGAAVVIDGSNQLGTVVSSRRFKQEIKPMERASEVLFALKPVIFHYKKEVDPKGNPQLGLVAEDVENVNPSLVVHDQEGKPYSVRYDQVNAMLLNEFLKEHSKVEKLEATVAKQHKDFEAALADLKGQIQKVSAQLEVSRRAPHVAENNQ
jgi:hypothetical protein